MFADFSLQSSIMGLTSSDLARRYEVGERTARRWISGKAMPPEPVAEDVAELFRSFLESLGSMIETLDFGGEVFEHVLSPDDPNYKHLRPLVQAAYLLCCLRGIETDISFS
ncbi:helix-turn-helix transcriptional regulator [Varibaculum cambriense]|nr:helix-turn-helix transcriptional regulator [Varibaculum cambriense]